MLKKGAAFTDIHFGRHNNSEMHNTDCVEFVDWFCENVRKDKTIDHIYFLGDWHENRSAINGLTLKYSYAATKKLNDLGLPVYFIVGNHDLYYRNNRAVFTTEIFDSLENFVLVDTPKVLDNIYGKVLVCPYLNDDEYGVLVEHSNIPVVFGHFSFKGFVLTGESYTLDHGPDPDNFSSPKHIFSGHFHKRQHNKNISYIGNAFPMDFGDANDTKRGMMIYDFVNDLVEYKDWEDCPKYIKASLTEVLKSPAKKLAANARVKIAVDTDLTYEESTQLRELLEQKYGLRELSLEEAPTPLPQLSEEEKEIESLQLESTDEIIVELLKRIKSDSIDVDALVKIYGELK